MQEESLWDPIKMQGDRADPLFQVQQIFCVPESEGEGSVSSTAGSVGVGEGLSSGAGEAQAESKRKRDNTRTNHFCFMLVNRLSCLNNFSIERRVEEGCRSVSKIL